MEDIISTPFEVIGNIAIVSLAKGSDEHKRKVSRSIMDRHRNVKTVLNKVARVGGETRTAGYEILEGDSTVTLHREYGYQYRLDLAQVFFTGHLAYERNRVASEIRRGEKVLVPFAGVGPFVIPVASRAAFVLAIDGNPEACRWLYENVRLNRVEDKVQVVFGDVNIIAELSSAPLFDRAVIPAPYGQERILYSILPHIHQGGRVHIYCFKKERQIEGLVSEYRNRGLEVIAFRKCGNVAPSVNRWVFDLKMNA